LLQIQTARGVVLSIRVSATKLRLLRTAIEVVGGPDLLAERVGVTPSMVDKLLLEPRLISDAVLLRAIDIVLDDRESRVG